ncbi:calponin-2-like [Octopus vulgaris]|uniref:Transgelin n=1 Tax=Octopus vulgaris TaxID=6645 RepID=A0AA36FHL1_OCTVU|nr:calponin-2-like [Octopus vulgaris]
MALRLGPKGMDRAIQSKVLSKYDTSAEQEVRDWVKQLVDEDIGGGPYEVEKQLKSGVTLVKLAEKVIGGTPDDHLPSDAKTCTLKTNASATPFKQMENIETFLRACKAYGVPDNSCFQTVDLFEGRNMAMVIATLLQLGTEAQRHNFNGPQCGPKPHESRTVHFEPEVKRAGQGIVILQAGTNKYATQKGMVMGGVRHIADIRCDQYDAESNKDVCLQSGSNKFASQKGMSFGAVRHGNDIKSEEITDEGKRTINLQYGYTAGANQSGMSFGKNRSIVD